MTTVEIDGTVYTRRDYTPKRAGERAGHGWHRPVDVGLPTEHRAEVPAAVVVLIDEIVRLSAEREALAGWVRDRLAETMAPEINPGNSYQQGKQTAYRAVLTALEERHHEQA